MEDMRVGRWDGFIVIYHVSAIIVIIASPMNCNNIRDERLDVMWGLGWAGELFD